MVQTTETTAFIGIDTVIQRTGMSDRTLRRRGAAGLVPVYADPRDYRRRLIAIDDLPALTQPQPVSRPAKEVRRPTA